MASGDGVPRIPLRMHLMISAWDTVVESELEWLGLAAQILESERILTGPLLHPSGDWRPGDIVQVVTDDVALESMSEAFQALTTDYRLCLLYRRPGDRPRGTAPVAPPVTTVGRAPHRPRDHGPIETVDARPRPCTGWPWRSSAWTR